MLTFKGEVDCHLILLFDPSRYSSKMMSKESTNSKFPQRRVLHEAFGLNFGPVHVEQSEALLHEAFGLVPVKLVETLLHKVFGLVQVELTEALPQKAFGPVHAKHCFTRLSAQTTSILTIWNCYVIMGPTRFVYFCSFVRELASNVSITTACKYHDRRKE